jgi:fatty acid desaturase
VDSSIKQLLPIRFGALVAIDLALVALAYALLFRWPTWPVAVVSVFLVGTRQHSLAILGHEATHFLVSRNRIWNDLVGNVVGFWPLFVTLEGYRSWHFEHHQSVGTPEDPERLVKKGRLYTLPLKQWQFVLLFLGDLVGLGSYELVRLVYVIRPRPLRYVLGPVLFWTAATLVCWRLSVLWVLGVWVVAIFTSFWSCYRVGRFAEHTGIGSGTYRFGANPLLRFLFFPNNSHYHYEHHRWPSIPCYHLPRTRELDTEVPVMTVSEMFRFFATGPA